MMDYIIIRYGLIVFIVPLLYFYLMLCLIPAHLSRRHGRSGFMGFVLAAIFTPLPIILMEICAPLNVQGMKDRMAGK